MKTSSLRHPGPPPAPSPDHAAPTFGFMMHGSHALGLGRAALDAARALIGQKRDFTGAPLLGQPRLQAIVGRATALVESARAFLYGAAAELLAAVEGGATDCVTLRARLRLATSHAVTASVEAIDLLHGAMATSAIFESSPLERLFRDVHTAAAHLAIGPQSFEAAGRVELGLPAALPYF